MTVTEARKILAEEAVGLTDTEIKEIINWLNSFAEIVLNSIEQHPLEEGNFNSSKPK